MNRKIILPGLALFLTLALSGCAAGENSTSPETAEPDKPLESVEGRQIKMIAGDVEVIITLNDSMAAADLYQQLPLEMELIERNSFAKGMTLPDYLYTDEEETREYQIGDFGYWAAGPDLAIFYDDIYDQTVVPVIPLGHAEEGAEDMRDTSGTVRLEAVQGKNVKGEKNYDFLFYRNGKQPVCRQISGGGADQHSSGDRPEKTGV